MFRKSKFFAVLAFVCAASVAHAAIDNTGCDNEENMYITPELALCSTHVYNIGDNQNPTNDATRQLMRDAVALKSTLIAQQMYAQYEYLETMVQRLKTQLQKEILLTKLEAAGATPSGTSTSSATTSNDKNVVLVGAKNCQLEAGTTAVLKCIQNNINVVLNAINGNNRGEARKQLERDLGIAQTWGATASVDKKWRGFLVDAKTTAEWSDMSVCNQMQAKSDNITQCAYMLNAAIAKKLEAMTDQANRNRAPSY